MKIFNKAFLSSLGTMVLTIVHHAYGALIYEAPFRLHVVFFAIPVIIVLLLAQRIHRWRSQSRLARTAFWTFILLTLCIPVGLIGFFEGGYNHLLKNILYFGGMSQPGLNRLFPAPTYEMPDNFWFEATGVLQFFTAVYCLYYLIRYWKEKGAAALPEITKIQRDKAEKV
jgi:hypothetical protein